MRRNTLALLCGATLCFLLVQPALAQIKTPDDYVAYWVEPYAGHLGVRLQRFGQNAARHGYIVEIRLFDWQTGPYPFANYQQDAQWGCGLWGFYSHGSATGHSIMSWPLTTDGYNARHAAYVALLQTGLRDMVDIYESQSAGGYSVSVTVAYLASTFRSEGGLVFNGACDGHPYSTSWTGARCVLDYTGPSYNTTTQVHCDTIFTRMNGERGVNNRQAFYAIDGTPLSFSGNLFTVLSPTITNINVVANETFHAPKTVVVTFDADMDTGNPADDIDVDGLNFSVSDRRWLNKVQLAAEFRPQYIGSDILRVTAQNPDIGNYDGLVSEGGIPLDGNGVGPNKDDRTVKIYSAVDNPGMLAELKIVRDNGNARIEWTVEQQSLTVLYIVQRKLEDGSWETVATVPADSSRFTYSVTDIGHTEGRYQVLEVTTSGQVNVMGADDVRDDVPTALDPVYTEAQSDSMDLALRVSSPTNLAQAQNTTSTHDIAYIFPERWRSRVQPLIDRRLSQGYKVAAVSLESIGWENGIQPYIRDAYTRGLWGATIVSRLTDSRAWNITPWWIKGWVRQSFAEDSTSCVLHVPFVHDVADSQYRSVSWFTPYVPFIPFGDVDGDSLNEVAISVIPADTTYQVTNAVTKILAYDNLDVSHGTVVVAAQALNLIGNDGSLALATADTVAKLIPSNYTVKRLTDTDATAYSYQTRENMFKMMVNPTDAANRVVGKILTGVSINASNWHWVTRSSFDWGEIAANADISAVLGLSCELGGHTRRRDQTVGIRTSSSAVVSWPDRGPALIMGLGCGSNQILNKEFALAFMSYVRNGARSGPDAAMKASRQVALSHPGYQQAKHAMMSVMSIGDVASKWPGMTIQNVAVERDPQTFLRLSITPNPGRHPTIHFAVPTAARVTLMLYDVSGRLVVRLVDDNLTPGTYFTRVNQSLRAGLYFARLTDGSRVMKERMVILH